MSAGERSPSLSTDSASRRAEALALVFLQRVWGPQHDLEAIDELMTEDYVIVSGGKAIRGRAAFKVWVREFQERLHDAITISHDCFANAAGDRVVSRWICTGKNNGVFNLSADGRPLEFSGIAIWRIQGDRLAECWVERSVGEFGTSD